MDIEVVLLPFRCGRVYNTISSSYYYRSGRSSSHPTRPHCQRSCDAKLPLALPEGDVEHSRRRLPSRLQRLDGCTQHELASTSITTPTLYTALLRTIQLYYIPTPLPTTAGSSLTPRLLLLNHTPSTKPRRLSLQSVPP